MTKQRINYLLMLAVCFVPTVVAFAQETEDEGPDPPPPVASIDTSLYLLAGAALLLACYAYSMKKLRKDAVKNV